MNTCRKHRTLALVATMIVSLLTIASPAAAAPAQKGKKASEFQLQTDSLPAITRGDTAWVAVSWFAGGSDVENVRVTAKATAGATVAYPANTVDHSGPYSATGITAGGIDFTAIQVTVPANAGKKVKLDIDVTWEENGKTEKKNHRLDIPVTEYSGQDLQVLTETVTVDPAVGGWVGVEFAGLAPSLSDFQLTVTDAAGLALQFPLGSHTSLHANSTLEDGETDVARFYIAPAGGAEGPVQIQYEISYVGGASGGPVTTAGSLDVAFAA